MNDVSIKRMEKPEVELYCEAEGIAFRTLWSPGYPWQMEAVSENVENSWELTRLLMIFNQAKTKFDRIIKRLEREYSEFDRTISELPEVGNGKV
jgi:hypothetical protein